MKQTVWKCRFCGKFTEFSERLCNGCDIIVNKFGYAMDYERSSFYGVSKEHLLAPYNIVPEDQLILKNKFREYESCLVQQERIALLEKTRKAEEKRLEDKKKFEDKYGSDKKEIRDLMNQMDKSIMAISFDRDKLNSKLTKIRAQYLKFKRYLELFHLPKDPK